MSQGNETLLGRVAIAAKLITMDQLETALREHGRSPSVSLGQTLVDLGFLSAADLERVVATQRKVIAKARARAAAEQQPPGSDAPPTRKFPATPPRPETVVPAAPPAPEAKSAAPDVPLELDPLLRDAAEVGASDIHVHAGAPVKLRLRGELLARGDAPLDRERAERLALSALGPEERAAFEAHGEVDLCYALDGVGRFRTNVYRQLHGVDAAFRYIPPAPPTLEELGLPSSMAKLTAFHQGMVLITGPKSCGKSSTLAALVNLINEERREHILTIEDPIEYLHPSKRCLVNQRSVRRHTQSFARALRAALREDPDVIVIGELRDLETISLALSAAETGHLVLATLHTDNTVRTVGRIVGAFPPDQQPQVRAMLSESLKAVISQRLVPTADGDGQVCALETMLVNRALGNLIRENKTVQMISLLETGSAQGMGLLDQSLARLVSEKRITREQALSLCESPTRIPEGS